jgi:hypothetical protein
MILYHDRAIDILAGTIRARGVGTENFREKITAQCRVQRNAVQTEVEKVVALRSGSPGHAGLFVQRLRFAWQEVQPLQTLAFSARS